MKPPHSRIINWAANELLALLTVDSVSILIIATRDTAVRDAVANLLVALDRASTRRRG